MIRCRLSTGVLLVYRKKKKLPAFDACNVAVNITAVYIGFKMLEVTFGGKSAIDNLASHVSSLLALTHTTTRHQTGPTKQDHTRLLTRRFLAVD